MQFTHTVMDENGIHARPAGLAVREAQRFQANLTLACGEKICNLKKLFSLMGMAVKQNNTVTVTAEGPDEAQAISTLEAFFKENF